MSWSALLLLLASGTSLGAEPIGGPPRFRLGLNSTSLSLLQHPDGTLILQASDTEHSVTCFGLDRSWWLGMRALFAGIVDGWYRKPQQRFASPGAQPGPLPAAAGPTTRTCELSAFTDDYRVYLEVVAIEHGIRADYVRVELSPIATSHTITEILAVQRVEDNTFGVRLAQAAVALTDALAGDTTRTLSKLELLEAEIEDTTTYNVTIIEAHSDLALCVLVLDVFVRTGKLPRNDDIAAAYRVKDILKDDRPELFIRVLGRLAQGETASSLLLRLQACGEGADPSECLD